MTEKFITRSWRQMGVALDAHLPPKGMWAQSFTRIPVRRYRPIAIHRLSYLLGVFDRPPFNVWRARLRLLMMFLHCAQPEAVCCQTFLSQGRSR